MNHSGWEVNDLMINGHDMTTTRNTQQTRSQDDANVDYFYQRPHTDMVQHLNKRWAPGDDSILEMTAQGRPVAYLERELHSISLESAKDINAKKIWEENKTGDKWSNSPWPVVSRNDHDTWTSGGTSGGLLSVDMAEYVLGSSSPDTRISSSMKRYTGGGDADGPKHLDNQKDKKERLIEEQARTPLLSNAVDDSPNKQASQSEDDGGQHGDEPRIKIINKCDEFSGPVASAGVDLPTVAILPTVVQQQQQQQSFQSDVSESSAYLQSHHDYMMPTVNDTEYQMVGRQQMIMDQAQTNGYVTQPTALGTTHVMQPAQYYSVQAPWAVYPTNILPTNQQQQQQAPVYRHYQRPVTPHQTGPEGEMSMQQDNTLIFQNPQYQIIAAQAYYDQNGQLVMNNGRNLPAPMRLVSPAAPHVMQGGQNGVRILAPNPQQQPPNYASNTSTPHNSLTDAYGNGPTSQQAFSPQTFTSPYAHSAPNARRDSFGSLDFKGQSRPPFPAQFYSPIGGTVSPLGTTGLSTPPPVHNLSTQRTPNAFYSPAPGAEVKYRQSGQAPSGPTYPMTIMGGRSGAKTPSKEPARSRLLEDFRSNRLPNIQLKELVNHVVEFSQDQHGSRFIQQKLERATLQEKTLIFNEILPMAFVLMTDVFGNYVIQKFFDFGSNDQKATLANKVKGNVLMLALQMYGCRVIQKALECIQPDMQVDLVKELDGNVLKCVKDQNGNHVIQKCIECVEPKNLDFVINSFKNQVTQLSTHPYGCRVIQRVLENCTSEQVGVVLDEMHENTDRLIQDQYGNYVIQHVLEHGRAEDKTKIVKAVRGKVMTLSQHKFASNVVEKCVSHSSAPERRSLIDEVLQMNESSHNGLYTMMKDQYANYVIQKMIDVADSSQKKLLVQKIRPHVTTLRKYTYGKHILAKLEKFCLKANRDLGPIGMPPNGALPR